MTEQTAKSLAELEEIEKILAGDDRFFCEIYRCNMLKTACITRQETTAGIAKAYQDKRGISKFYGKPGFSDVNCRECKQGKKIMEEHQGQEGEDRKEEIEKSEKPASPVDIDALIDGICSKMEIDRNRLYQKDGSTKILRPLRVRLAQALAGQGLAYEKIAPLIGCAKGTVSSYVRDYDWAKNKNKKSKNKSLAQARSASKSPDIEKTTGPKNKAETVDTKNTLTIDFSEHLHALESIKEIAKSEIRTPENQVLYWLKEFSLIAGKEDRNDAAVS